MTEATYPKKGTCTQEEQTAGTKQIKCEMLQNGQAASIGTITPDRIYSRDYSKIDVDNDQHDDTLTPFLGNPLRW
jgi:hypothetical protein